MVVVDEAYTGPPHVLELELVIVNAWATLELCITCVCIMYADEPGTTIAEIDIRTVKGGIRGITAIANNRGSRSMLGCSSGRPTC